MWEYSSKKVVVDKQGAQNLHSGLGGGSWNRRLGSYTHRSYSLQSLKQPANKVASEQLPCICEEHPLLVHSFLISSPRLLEPTIWSLWISTLPAKNRKGHIPLRPLPEPREMGKEGMPECVKLSCFCHLFLAPVVWNKKSVCVLRSDWELFVIHTQHKHSDGDELNVSRDSWPTHPLTQQHF